MRLVAGQATPLTKRRVNVCKRLFQILVAGKTDLAQGSLQKSFRRRGMGIMTAQAGPLPKGRMHEDGGGQLPFNFLVAGKTEVGRDFHKQSLML
jgi:hypothetical protein